MNPGIGKEKFVEKTINICKYPSTSTGEVKKVKVRKLYNGCASVRDYIVEMAIVLGKDLEIQYQKRTMTVPLAQCKEKFQFHRYEFTSKYSSMKYMLIDFPFVPDDLTKE